MDGGCLLCVPQTHSPPSTCFSAQDTDPQRPHQWASWAFQGNLANEESQKEFGGMEESEAGVSIPLILCEIAYSWLLSRGHSTCRVNLSAPSFLSRFQWHLHPHPLSLGVLCYPCGPFPPPCPHLGKCPFIKFSCNHPNLNVPPVFCWNTLDIDGHGVCACWFSGCTLSFSLQSAHHVCAPEDRVPFPIVYTVWAGATLD